MNNITVLIDFTDTCYKSVEFSFKIAKRAGAEISLLHVSSEPENDEKSEEQIRKYALLLEENKIDYSINVAHGNFFSSVENAVAKIGSDLVIVGTHGKTGLKQNLLGSNILKLVQLLKVSTLVVQDNSIFPEKGFDKILFPVVPNLDFEQKTRQVAEFAKIFNSTICLYTLEDHMDSYAVEVQLNLKRTKAILDKEGLQYEHCVDESEEFSVGYARQTLKYAENNKMSLISILSTLAKVNTYYGKVDKENILLNKTGIPVFCANDLT
jgi:nucleotide-binding universal stress UspA family protein